MSPRLEAIAIGAICALLWYHFFEKRSLERSIDAEVVREKGPGFAAIGGMKEIIEDIKISVIEPLLSKERSKLMQPPRGVLLIGPPGCGKSVLAKAVAQECGATFISIQPSTICSKWYGESQKMVSTLFKFARKNAPSIIFIDEVDSFLRNRASMDHETTAQIKAEFLSLWDGLDSCSHVVVMGATNRPSDLDEAVLRRMSKRFHIRLPQKAERIEMLKIFIEDDGDLDLERIADITDGKSGSEIFEFLRDKRCRVKRPLQNTDFFK